MFEEVSELKTSLGRRVTRFAENDSKFSKNHLKMHHFDRKNTFFQAKSRSECGKCLKTTKNIINFAIQPNSVP